MSSTIPPKYTTVINNKSNSTSINTPHSLVVVDTLVAEFAATLITLALATFDPAFALPRRVAIFSESDPLDHYPIIAWHRYSTLTDDTYPRPYQHHHQQQQQQHVQYGDHFIPLHLGNGPCCAGLCELAF